MAVRSRRRTGRERGTGTSYKNKKKERKERKGRNLMPLLKDQAQKKTAMISGNS
jgi:hypothetical protein